MDKNRVEKLVRELIIEIGEDPTREGLRDTPTRIAKAYKEIFEGYDSNSELSVQFSEDSEVVVAKDIQFYSMCEPHMLPFFGKIQIAYAPNGRVFGISKLVRLVEKYSKQQGLWASDNVEFTKKNRQEHLMRGFEPEDILDDPENKEIIMGSFLIVLTLEAARRSIGFTLPKNKD